MFKFILDQGALECIGLNSGVGILRIPEYKDRKTMFYGMFNIVLRKITLD